MGIKAGEATLTMAGPKDYNGQKTVLIIFKADGLNFFDEENIYVTPEDYRPMFVERNLNIFGKKEKILEDYVSKKGFVQITKTTAANKKSTEEMKLKGEVDNIYGFIFRYRKNGSFKIGDTVDVRLPTKDLNIAVVKETSVDAAGKKYDSYYMESKPSKYKIWFDKSDKKWPLRISGAVGIANTAMVMSKYEE
jgi:hypothetical protein